MEFGNHPLTAEILAEFLTKPKIGYFRVSSKQMRYWKLATIWYSGPSPHVSFVEQTNSSGARNGNHVEVLRRQEEELKRVTKHLGKKEPKEKTKFAVTTPISQDILLINFGQQYRALVANWKELSPEIKLLILHYVLGSRFLVIFQHRWFALAMTIDSLSGRSCTGARVAPAEKFGLGRKF